MGLRSWFRSSAKQKLASIPLSKLDIAAALKENVKANASISAITARAHTATASIDKKSADSKASPPADKAHFDSVAPARLGPHLFNYSASPSAETQIATGNAIRSADVSPDDGSEWSFVIIDGNDEETALDPPRRLNSSVDLSEEEQTANCNAMPTADILPDDGTDTSHPLSYSGATLVEPQTVGSNIAPSEDLFLDRGSVWSFEINDEEYVAKHALVASNEVPTAPVVSAPTGATLPEYKHVDKNVGDAEGVVGDAEEAAQEHEADGQPRRSDDTSTADGKRVTDNDALLLPRVEHYPESPGRVVKEPVEFDDEEIPLKDDADTFIIPMLDYPSERNGALQDELAAAVRTPVVAAALVAGAAKRMAEDLLAPRTLKRVFMDMKGTLADGVVNCLNAATAGYDVPEIAARIVEPIVNIRDKMPTQENTDKLVDQAADKAQAMLRMRKVRWFMKIDPLDASGMADMVDAHRVFAHEMCLGALQALVDDGICLKWQIHGDPPILKCRYVLEQALATFYLQHKQNMQPEDLMAAIPSWFIDKKNGCFILKLFATWNIYDDPDVGSRSEFLATNFTLPETLCKMSTATVCADLSPMAKKEDDGKSDHGLEDGNVVLQDVEVSDHTDEDEDDGVVWLDDEDSEGDVE